MKQMIFTLFICACAVLAWGETFQMGPRGDAVVEVDKVGGEYKVTCTFSPQTKFGSAVNAKFNDAKGDSLCKKGIARYLNVGTNDHFSISGLYVVAPVKNIGGKLRYAFAVPVAGCKVEVGVAKPKGKPRLVAKSLPAVTNVVPQPQMSVVKTNAAPSAKKTMTPVVAPNKTPVKILTARTVRSASYMSVVKYKEVNGRRSMVSRREYRGSDFKSQQEFDRLCASEFARIRALGEENLREVQKSKVTIDAQYDESANRTHVFVTVPPSAIE